MVEWEDFSEDKCPICGHPSDIDSVSQHMEAQHHVEYGLARVILKMIKTKSTGTRTGKEKNKRR